MVTIPHYVADAICGFKKSKSSLNNVLYWAYSSPSVSDRAGDVYDYIKKSDENLEKFIIAYTKGYKIEKPKAPYYNNEKSNIGVCFNYALSDMEDRVINKERLIYIKIGENNNFIPIANSISRSDALNISKTLKDLVNYYDKYFS